MFVTGFPYFYDLLSFYVGVAVCAATVSLFLTIAPIISEISRWLRVSRSLSATFHPRLSHLRKIDLPLCDGGKIGGTYLFCENIGSERLTLISYPLLFELLGR